MMRLFLLLFLFLAGLNAMAQTERTTVFFQDMKWEIGDHSSEESQFFAIEEETALRANASLTTTFNPDVAFQFVLLTIPSSHFFNVYINNEQVSAENNKDGFVLDLTEAFLNAPVKLVLKSKIKMLPGDLKQVWEYSRIDFISGLGITNVVPREDLFFGGSMVEIGVRNQFDADIDGKLIVRLIDPTTLEDIAENNNCAFSRSNSEIAIEVNFPDLDIDLKGKQLLVNVSLVDKENGESLVDELELPLLF